MSSVAPFPFPWLSQTKFLPPTRQLDLLTRSYSQEKLKNGITNCRLTLVMAQAGYGKTTLLSSLSTLSPHTPLAWVALDKADDDPLQFLTVITAALWWLNPGFGLNILSMIDSPTGLGSTLSPEQQQQRLMGILINDILAAFPEPFVLILDDLHCLKRPSIYLMLDYLLERMPAQMHLVIASRLMPPISLARLRARRELIEIGTPELQFTADEVKLLLDTHSHNEFVNEIDELLSWLEGWPAGIQLLLNSLTKMPAADMPAFLHPSTQARQDIFAYLAEEVLQRQPDDIQQFLLETAILDELTPSLCRHLTGREDAGTLLTHLFEQDFFLTRFSSENMEPTYRFLDLFVEFLRERCRQQQPQRFQQLHETAAETIAEPHLVINHLITAKLWEKAADKIEELALDWSRPSLLDRVRRWVTALPQPIFDKRPRLQFMLGSFYFTQHQQPMEAMALLKAAKSEFKASGETQYYAKCVVTMASSTLLHLADISQSNLLIQEALTLNISTFDRMHLLFIRGVSATLFHNWESATADLNEALQIVENNQDDFTWRNFFSFYASAFLLYFAPSGFRRMAKLSRRAQKEFQHKNGLFQVGIGNGLMFADFWEGHFQKAVKHGEDTIKICERYSFFSTLSLETVLGLATIYDCLGNEGKITRHLNLGHAWLAEFAASDQISYWIITSKLQLIRGDMVAAAQSLQKLEQEQFGYMEFEKPRMLRFLRWLQAVMVNDFTNVDEELSAIMKDQLYEYYFGDFRFWRAFAQHKQGLAAALVTFLPLLQEAKEQAQPGIIWQHGRAAIPLLHLVAVKGSDEMARYAEMLLGNAGISSSPSSPVTQKLPDLLTKRQLEILRLVAEGKSNKAIAQTLFISIGTVKSHIHQIFQKLAVKSRSQAIALAHELGVLA